MSSPRPASSAPSSPSAAQFRSSPQSPNSGAERIQLSTITGGPVDTRWVEVGYVSGRVHEVERVCIRTATNSEIPQICSSAAEKLLFELMIMNAAS